VSPFSFRFPWKCYFRRLRHPRSQPFVFEIPNFKLQDSSFADSIDFLQSCCRSTVQTNTLQPVWNELWKVKNVPSNAELRVQVLDKDDGPKDDYIGRFTTNVEPGAKEEEIHGRITKRTKGTFWLKVRKFSSLSITPLC
jgi:Ca2+-dependent lipid-binding protein